MNDESYSYWNEEQDDNKPSQKDSDVMMVGMVIRFGIDGGLPFAKTLERVVGVVTDVEAVLCVAAN